MFDVALARHNLQAPWLTQPDSEVWWLLSIAAQLTGSMQCPHVELPYRKPHDAAEFLSMT
jgi:hypothetical protein